MEARSLSSEQKCITFKKRIDYLELDLDTRYYQIPVALNRGCFRSQLPASFSCSLSTEAMMASFSAVTSILACRKPLRAGKKIIGTLTSNIVKSVHTIISLIFSFKLDSTSNF